MKGLDKIFNLISEIDNEGHYKIADRVDSVMCKIAEKINENIMSFLSSLSFYEKIIPYRIITILEVLDVDAESIKEAVELAIKRFMEIVFDPDNKRELTVLFEDDISDFQYERLNRRKGNMPGGMFVMDIMANWVTEEAIMPYMSVLFDEETGEFNLGAFDKDRKLNLLKALEKGGMDFVDSEGKGYELKTRWGIKKPVKERPPFYVKPTKAVRTEDGGLIYGDFAEFGRGYDPEDLPPSFYGALYGIPLDTVRKSPLKEDYYGHSHPAYRIQLTGKDRASPIREKSISMKKIRRNKKKIDDLVGEDWTKPVIDFVGEIKQR